ncbi:MAG: AAA+ family ATPase, partial [Terriglobales bacterium]
PEARLVILPPAALHIAKDAASQAHRLAAEILDQRSSGQRNYRNALVFLAADGARMPELDTKTRQFLAWDSIVQDANRLNLDPAQLRQAADRREQASRDLDVQIAATYIWVLAPHQTKGEAEEWLEFRCQGGDAPAERVAKKLTGEALLHPMLSATELRLELDRVPLWRGAHVGLQQLAEDFARYLYLPRLREPAREIAEAVGNGLALTTWEQDGAAYADAWDEAENRYRGLRAGELLRISAESQGLVVKPEAALAQRQREKAQAQAAGVGPGMPSPPSAPGGGPGPLLGGTAHGSAAQAPLPAAAPAAARRFHASVALDPQRLARDAGKIADEIVQHRGKLANAKVQVTLEIHAEMPDGASTDTVRTVNENCRTLRAASFGFEDE